MCPLNVVSEHIISHIYKSDFLQESNLYNVIHVSFEYIFKQRKHTERKNNKQKKNIFSNVAHIPKKKTQTIAKNNPIFDVLHRNENIGPKLKVQPKPEKKNIESNLNRCITQRVWGLKAIAPLIIWLQKKNKRYCNSDWVNHYSNGERDLILTQRGEIISKAHVEQKQNYSCSGGFHNVYLRYSIKHTKQCSNNDEDADDVEIWSSFIHKDKTNVYCRSYQQRCYTWDSCTTILLQTVDGKQFNVSVEHDNPHADVNATEQFHELIATLSYHLSQHTHHQTMFML